MIIVKTPFRISFAGGGSDMASFYRRSPGGVLSTTIDKYMYVMIHPYFYDKIRIKYSRTEDVESTDDIKHPLVRECLRLFRIHKGMEIASIADVPAGTGLGSSSAFTVALLHALAAYTGRRVSASWLARSACRIEIDRVGEPIGKQDQYAVAHGGLNFIRFNPDHSVSVRPVRLAASVERQLQDRLMLFYVGKVRDARHILSRQKENVSSGKPFAALKKMVCQAVLMRDMLLSGDLDGFGDLLHEGWLLKKQLASGISDPQIDSLYETVYRSGGRGKLLGAGGGGFLLVYCRPQRQEALRKTLGLRELRFRFSDEGTSVFCSDLKARESCARTK